MPNMLEVELNGAGAPRAAADLVEPETRAKRRRALDALALANLPFAEELYFQFLHDPASVDPEWRRMFVSSPSSRAPSGCNGAGPTALVPPASFPRSIFAGRAAVRPTGRPLGAGRHPEPHFDAPALRARAAARRGVPRARASVRRSRSAGAGHARRARRSRSRTTASPTRTSTWCSAARTSPGRGGRRCAIWSACCARPTAARSACRPRTSTISSCATGCKAGWRARATGCR